MSVASNNATKWVKVTQCPYPTCGKECMGAKAMRAHYAKMHLCNRCKRGALKTHNCKSCACPCQCNGRALDVALVAAQLLTDSDKRDLRAAPKLSVTLDK